jgi:ATP-binding protein involved in chromosome partitioning
MREDLAIASTGFILGEDQPLGIDAMTAGLLAKQLVHAVRWPDLAYLIVDLPPGTSAVQQLLVKELTCAGAIVVVTPELLAHLDGRKAVQMFRALNVRVLGGIENMAGSMCPHCSNELRLFPVAPHERSIWAMGVERLAQVPFRLVADPPASSASSTPTLLEFEALAASVVQRLNG